MTDDEQKDILIKMLVTAMLVHIFEHKDEEDDEELDLDDMHGIVGGPEKPGDPEPPAAFRGSDDLSSLDRHADLIMRCLQAATRYCLAREMGMLYEDDEGSDMVDMTPIGVTFVLRFKKTSSLEDRKILELGAELTESYFRYRMFERSPSAEEFRDSINWQGNLSEKQIEEIGPFINMALDRTIPLMHEHHSEIKKRGMKIFQQCLSHIHTVISKQQASRIEDLLELIRKHQ